MDKPDRPTTVINIQGIDVDAWQLAKVAAKRRGETMGEWLSRACAQQANREANDGIIMPGQEAKPLSTVSEKPRTYDAEVQSISVLLTAMGAAGAKPSRDAVGKANRLINLIGANLPPVAKGGQGALRIGRDEG